MEAWMTVVQSEGISSVPYCFECNGVSRQRLHTFTLPKALYVALLRIHVDYTYLHPWQIWHYNK